jgi:dimethylargininase
VFTRALVCPPASSFARGLTTAGLGPPVLELALEQHARYVVALRECGLAVTELPPDPAFPDSTFVEDTAVLVPGCAIVARPGAESRAGEAAAVRAALRPLFEDMRAIEAPGTLDGGDVCAAGEHVFIGHSQRTNAEGARQLAALLGARGCTTATIDVRRIPGLLHLKSGLAWVGGKRLLAIEALRDHPALSGWQVLPVPREEEYAANCVLLGERVLVPAGFPGVTSALDALGLDPLALDVSEFRKMDGGPSCLSLRF